MKHILTKNLKFEPENKKESIEIQNLLFEYGCQWCSGDTIPILENEKYLYLDNMNLGFGENEVEYKQSSNKLMTFINLKKHLNVENKLYNIYGKEIAIK